MAGQDGQCSDEGLHAPLLSNREADALARLQTFQRLVAAGIDRRMAALLLDIKGPG